MSIRLEREGLPPLELTAENGWYVSRLDLGYPFVRAVADDRPLASGTDDRTRFHSARVVTLDLTARGDRNVKQTELGPYLVPFARSFLFFPAGDGTERRVLLRARDRTAPFDGPPGKHRIIAQFDAPNGTVETALLGQAVATATEQVEPGFAFNLTFDLSFPLSTPVGATGVFTFGDALCPPVLRLFGPCTNPRIENVSEPDEEGRAKRLAFDITLGAGEFLEVDVRERTVKLNGNPRRDRYGTLDFPESRWWTLQPGDNLVRYFPEVFAGASRAEVDFRCQFI